jgi:hypothetical protein
MNTLKELQDWYKCHCNDYWEHDYRVKIGTLDNPGWSVEINLADTNWENKIFNTKNIQRQDEDDWIYCKVENKIFTGCGGPENLEEILKVFIAWVYES